MIADKIMPALYVIDLEGKAANLDFLVGEDFGIQRITLGSLNFENDLQATAAGQRAIEFLLDSPQLDVDEAEETVSFNPEFFPSLPAIIPTEEDLKTEAAAEEEAEEYVEDGQFPVIVTKRFDSLGDYVTSRLEVVGEDFKVKLRVAIDPNLYITEKGKGIEAQTAVNTPHREITHQVSLH